MAIPAFNPEGDLPIGLYQASLSEIAARFGAGGPRRILLTTRLERIHDLARNTGFLARFVVFGSFITSKPEPNDVDVYMIMSDNFDVGALQGESALLFDHLAAQSHFGCSVFWVRRMAALGGEDASINDWQVKRDGNRRGLIEVIRE